MLLDPGKFRITQRDSNDFLTDNLGYGEKLRKQGNQDVLHDRMTFRASFQEMMDSVKTPYDQCIKTLLENIKLAVALTVEPSLTVVELLLKHIWHTEFDFPRRSGDIVTKKKRYSSSFPDRENRRVFF